MILPAFHGHPAFVDLWCLMYALWVVPETILSRRLRSATNARKSDKGSKVVIIATINLAVAVGFLCASIFPKFSIGRSWKVIFSVGIALWLGGTAFRWYSIRSLGRFFTYDVAVSNGQHVVESGPYRWVRHPSYAGSLLAEVGFGMTLTNWLAILLPVLCLSGAYAYRIRVEEQTLTQGLGIPYREYMQRTWRLIPFIF